MSISKELKGVISQMLKPLNNLNFKLVIEGLSGNKVLSFNLKNEENVRLLAILKESCNNTMINFNNQGITNIRPNEVGNKIEPLVKDSLTKNGLETNIPNDLSGKHKSVGYPDLVIHRKNKPTIYIECKTFNTGSEQSNLRSFYLSPSTNFKVTENAFHLALCFEMNKKNNDFKCIGWKILNLENITLNVKYEFNTNNAQMYKQEFVIAKS